MNKLLEEVGSKLEKVFESMGYTINVNETYLTSIAIDGEGRQLVDYSESLSRVIMEKVQADELPRFNNKYTGIFSKPWTFDRAHRIVELDAIDLNNAGRVVVESYRNK